MRSVAAFLLSVCLTTPSIADDAQDALEILDLSVKCTSKPIREQNSSVLHFSLTITKFQGDRNQLRIVTESKLDDEPIPYINAYAASFKDIEKAELHRPTNQTFADNRPVVDVRISCKKARNKCVDYQFNGSPTKEVEAFIPACNAETAQRIKLAIDTLTRLSN